MLRDNDLFFVRLLQRVETRPEAIEVVPLCSPISSSRFRSEVLISADITERKVCVVRVEHHGNPSNTNNYFGQSDRK